MHHTLKHQNGFALMVVIIVMLLVSVLASQLIMLVRTELKIAANAKARAAGLFLAEAGINLSIFRLKDKPLEIKDEADENFIEACLYEDYLPTGKITCYAVSETGKIDLNKSPQRLLELFLEYHGLDSDQVVTVVDSLLDWRDSDNLHRSSGAEKETYEELEPPYIPRNGDIVDPAEFFLVHGTDMLVGRFVPEEVFTVHNTKKKINFNHLTPAMLEFIMQDDEEKIAAYYETKKEMEGKLSSALARFIMGDARFDELKNFLTYTTTKSDPYYYIVAVGQAGYTKEEAEQEEIEEPAVKKQRPGIKLSVLVKLQGAKFEYVSWRETLT